MQTRLQVVTTFEAISNLLFLIRASGLEERLQKKIVLELDSGTGFHPFPCAHRVVLAFQPIRPCPHCGAFAPLQAD